MSTRTDFRILALDGGGIRGAFIASFLDKITENVGRPLHEHFDLIAGTSTGGIIAAGIALGIEPKVILDFYQTAGPKIFMRRKSDVSWKMRALHKLCKIVVGNRANDLDVDSLFGSKYDSAVLRATLLKVFKQAKVKDAQCLLTIPSVDLTKGQTVVMKTANFAGLTRDPERLMVDVLMATAAAPTYFPHATIEPGSAYVDGGLWANNPTLIAYAEAVKMRQKGAARAPVNLGQIRILSIGTGAQKYSISPPGLAAGIVFWLEPLFEVIANSQSQGVDFAMRYLVPESQYMRVDFEITDKTWKLDNTAIVDRLCHLGREKAVENLERYRNLFAPTATT